jgi:hypothetical protein
LDRPRIGVFYQFVDNFLLPRSALLGHTVDFVAIHTPL